MNPMPQLEPMLKQLRLSGILDSLLARNQQAIKSKLAYTDFLALLIQDEVARRDQRQFGQRLRKAQVSGDKTLERFDYSTTMATCLASASSPMAKWPTSRPPTKCISREAQSLLMTGATTTTACLPNGQTRASISSPA